MESDCFFYEEILVCMKRVSSEGSDKPPCHVRVFQESNAALSNKVWN